MKIHDIQMQAEMLLRGSSNIPQEETNSISSSCTDSSSNDKNHSSIEEEIKNNKNVVCDTSTTTRHNNNKHSLNNRINNNNNNEQQKQRRSSMTCIEKGCVDRQTTTMHPQEGSYSSEEEEVHYERRSSSPDDILLSSKPNHNNKNDIAHDKDEDDEEANQLKRIDTTSLLLAAAAAYKKNTSNKKSNDFFELQRPSSVRSSEQAATPHQDETATPEHSSTITPAKNGAVLMLPEQDSHSHINNENCSLVSGHSLPFVVPRQNNTDELLLPSSCNKTEDQQTNNNDEEMRILREENNKLIEALRLTVMELTSKENEVEAQNVILHQLEEEKALMEKELKTCRNENDELVAEIMDSNQMMEHLKCKNVTQEEAMGILAARNADLEQERDELAEELGETQHNADVELLQQRLEDCQRRAKCDISAALAEKLELETRLETITKERDDLEEQLRYYTTSAISLSRSTTPDI